MVGIVVGFDDGEFLCFVEGVVVVVLVGGIGE